MPTNATWIGEKRKENEMKFREIYVKEIWKNVFQLKIDDIICQLSDKDCQRVEFLRGMLAAYRGIVETDKGWVKKQVEYNGF